MIWLKKCCLCHSDDFEEFLYCCCIDGHQLRFTFFRLRISSLCELLHKSLIFISTHSNIYYVYRYLKYSIFFYITFLFPFFRSCSQPGSGHFRVSHVYLKRKFDNIYMSIWSNARYLINHVHTISSAKPHNVKLFFLYDKRQMARIQFLLPLKTNQCPKRFVYRNITNNKRVYNKSELLKILEYREIFWNGQITIINNPTKGFAMLGKPRMFHKSILILWFKKKTKNVFFFHNHSGTHHYYLMSVETFFHRYRNLSRQNHIIWIFFWTFSSFAESRINKSFEKYLCFWFWGRSSWNH